MKSTCSNSINCFSTLIGVKAINNYMIEFANENSYKQFT